MFALEPGTAGSTLQCIGRHMQRPEAIVVVSAHWATTARVCINGAPQPQTLHDFSGFPDALYALHYPAPGQPELAWRIASLLHHAGWQTCIDTERGLDHGVWTPLMHLFPQADIPVVQVSLPASGDADSAWNLGRALAPLRDAGVLLLGSGALTHNLHDLHQPDDKVTRYVHAFTDWVRAHVSALDHAALRGWRALAPAAQRAHPTDEHFLPLLVAMGAADDGAPVCIVDGGVMHGALSMDTYVFGTIPPVKH